MKGEWPPPKKKTIQYNTTTTTPQHTTRQYKTICETAGTQICLVASTAQAPAQDKATQACKIEGKQSCEWGGGGNF